MVMERERGGQITTESVFDRNYKSFEKDKNNWFIVYVLVYDPYKKHISAHSSK